MSDAKIFYIYGDHKDSDCVQNQVPSGSFDEARSVADSWIEKGMALVHIRETVELIENGVPCINERLVWAASSPDLDWR